MNLWRIAVDESTGAAVGAPEPVTAGVQASASLPAFSRDGSRLAFRSRIASVNPVAIPFDPVSLRAGAPLVLDTRNNIRIPSSVSPDGKQIAFFSIGEPQEDLFIGAPDEAFRRVTDDPARDRAPIFTPDGRSLVFYSNRDGRWGPWIIGVDGGGLRKLARPENDGVYAIVSPKGDAITFMSGSAQEIFIAPLTDGISTPTRLPGTEVNGKYFGPTAWSADGMRLAGWISTQSGRSGGVGVYDLATHRATEVSADETYGVQWLADSRRVAYFTGRPDQLIVVDTVTRSRTVIDVRLPGSPQNDVFAISPDNRTIYYGAQRTEADIWIVERR
jgi:Tol biopolymer transport system component